LDFHHCVNYFSVHTCLILEMLVLLLQLVLRFWKDHQILLQDFLEIVKVDETCLLL
jgi:hypothetical protein